MLSIKNLHVTVQNKTILHTLSADFVLGQNYCILGKNWSGKSSLVMTIMGNPSYTIKEWKILLDNEDISYLWADERAQRWIFLAFQHIPEVPWLKLFEFLRTIYANKLWEEVKFLAFKDKIKQLMDELDIDHEFLWRDLNVWFSGGERRKIEILQIKLLEPKYIILDEIDSGLDVDAFRSVAKLIQSLNNSNNCFIIITHMFTILDYIDVDKVLIMESGKISHQWWKDLALKIKNKGFTQSFD